VYRNGKVVATGTTTMSRIEGLSGQFALLGPPTNQYDNQSAKPGAFLQALVWRIGVNAGLRGQEIAELSARYSIGSTPVTPTPTPGSGTVTDLEPTGAYSALGFVPAQTGIYVNAAGDIYRSGALGMSAVNSTGLGSSYLPDNLSGRVCFQYKDGSAKNAALGFHTSRHRVALGTMAYGLYVNNDGYIEAISNGTPLAKKYLATVGNYYAVTRIGNTGVVRVEESTDGVNWTTLLTYDVTTKVALYVVMNLFSDTSQLQQPRGQSLTLINVPTASGHLDLKRVFNDSTGGGFALVPNNLLGLTAATYWFYWTPDQLAGGQSGYADFQLPLAVGMSGGADETFTLTVTGGAIDARVFGDGARPYKYTPDKLPLPGVGQGVFIGVTMDQASGLTLYVNKARSTTGALAFTPAQSTAPLTLGGGYDSAGGGLVQLAAGGTFECLGIANRVFSAAEMGVLSDALGRSSSISGTQHLFLFDSLLTNTARVTDALSAAQALIYSGEL
jgi:hypothetical protein